MTSLPATILPSSVTTDLVDDEHGYERQPAKLSVEA